MQFLHSSWLRTSPYHCASFRKIQKLAVRTEKCKISGKLQSTTHSFLSLWRKFLLWALGNYFIFAGVVAPMEGVALCYLSPGNCMGRIWRGNKGPAAAGKNKEYSPQEYLQTIHQSLITISLPSHYLGKSIYNKSDFAADYMNRQ